MTTYARKIAEAVRDALMRECQDEAKKWGMSGSAACCICASRAEALDLDAIIVGVAERCDIARYSPGIALDKVLGGQVAVMYSRTDGEYVKWADVSDKVGAAELRLSQPQAPEPKGLTDEQIVSIQYAAEWLSRSEDIHNQKHAERLRSLLAKGE